MITALRTNNFKKLESFSAEFKDGTNLVFGENGEGKSTAFDAIRFALFGSKGVTGTVDSLTTWNKTKMWVELDILGYTVHRSAANCKITDKDGGVVASGNSPSTRFCEELLACSVKDFDLLYMSKQNETAGLITFGATELNRKVEEYAGVAVIDKVIKSLGSEVHGCQVALESFEFSPVEELEKELSSIGKEGTSVKGEIERLTALRDTATEQVSECKDKYSKAVSFNNTQDEIEKTNQRIDNKLTSAKARRDVSAKQFDKANERLLNAKEVNQTDIDQVTDSLNTVLSASKKLAGIKGEAEIILSIDTAKEKVEAERRYMAELPSFEEAVEKAEARRNKLDLAHREANSAYRKACEVLISGVCSECDRPLEDHDPEAAEAKKLATAEELTKSKTILDVANDNLSTAKKTLSDHHKTNPGTGWENTVTSLETELAEVKSLRTQLEGTLSSFESEQTLRDKRDSLVSDQKEFIAATREVKTTTEDHEENEGVVSDLESSVKHVPEDKIDLAPLQLAYENKMTEKGNVAEELSKYSTRRAVLVERHKSVKSQIATANANNTKMAELEKSLSLAKQLRKYLNDERVKFMEGVWRTILGTASHFIDRSTEGWISAVGRNDKGDFTFTENGHEAIAKESASGSQKAFIGTAIKVGLAQAKMGSSAMVMLDEPTADMRDDRAAQLAAGLMMLSGQKIMITHRDSERMIAQNIIHVGE